MKKKSLGERFCDKLWEKLTAECENGKWHSGKTVSDIFDPQYFLKETIREMGISEAHAKRLLDLSRGDDYFCLNWEQTCDILNNPPDAKIPWFENEMIFKKAKPLYEERKELIMKKYSAGGLNKKEEKRLKELETEIDRIDSKTYSAKAARKEYEEIRKMIKKANKLIQSIKKSLAKNSKRAKGAQ